MEISNKQLQEKCWENAQKVADELNEAIVYDDQEDKFFLESKYKKECEKIKLVYKTEYTEEDWGKDKVNPHLFWYYPTKKE